VKKKFTSLAGLINLQSNLLSNTSLKKSIQRELIAIDVEASPVLLVASDGKSCQLKVDEAYQLANKLVVAGWCTGSIEIGLSSNGVNLEIEKIAISRQDVSKNLNLPNGESLGFLIVAPCPEEASLIVLTWHKNGDLELQKSKPLYINKDPFPLGVAMSSLGYAIALPSLSRQLQTESMQNVLSQIPQSFSSCNGAEGFLEAGVVCKALNEAVVVGWVVYIPGVQVWLQDDAGRTWPLHGYNYFREDVSDKFIKSYGNACHRAGFLIRVPGAQLGRKVDLKVLCDTGVHVLSSTILDSLSPDPSEAAKWLFGLVTPDSEFYKRLELIDAPIIDSLIQSQKSNWHELPIQHKKLGKLPEKPLVSLIIPLYGRSDFMEHQLIEFVDDEWLCQNAEVIYVIDDPKLLEGFISLAEKLHRLYRFPFLWVWGGANRGFSGANNLGAFYSSSPYIIFLNSDVIPQKPGWAKTLIDVLIDQPDVAVVGPRLVFADGSIQHASITFVHREELGVWLNRHPYMGCDPALDPHTKAAVVQAVTGACMAIRRSDLDRVGGWDTGYLIGDFEDSDLCMKLREKGLHIAYTPRVQLTHLERQSFKFIGEGEFRQKVVIYNAVRHKSRWKDLLSQELTISEVVEK